MHMFGHCFDNNACTPNAIMMKFISCTRLNFAAALFVSRLQRCSTPHNTDTCAACS